MEPVAGGNDFGAGIAHFGQGEAAVVSAHVDAAAGVFDHVGFIAELGAVQGGVFDADFGRQAADIDAFGLVVVEVGG